MNPALTDSLIHNSDLSQRLVPLSDGRSGLRGGIHVDVREPSADSPPSSPDTRHPSPSCLDFIASDETLDRYDEIISVAGWKLDSYQKNPVFQNAHKYGDIIFTLGKALITEIRSPSSISNLPSPILFQRIEFAVDVNPMAKIAYGLYKGKFLNAVSVGFVPVRWEDGTQTTSYSRKYLEQELLEVSAVGIPANPNALALGLKSGAIEKSDIQNTLDLLRQTLGSSADGQSGSDQFADHNSRSEQPLSGNKFVAGLGSQSPTSSRQSPVNHQLILQLTRDLHALLRHI